MINFENQIVMALAKQMQDDIDRQVMQEIGLLAWLNEHCPGQWHRATDGKIQFDDERDRVMFVLRWGHDNV